MKTFHFHIKHTGGEATGTYQAKTAKEVEDFLKATYESPREVVVPATDTEPEIANDEQVITEMKITVQK